MDLVPTVSRKNGHWVRGIQGPGPSVLSTFFVYIVMYEYIRFQVCVLPVWVP